MRKCLRSLPLLIFIFIFPAAFAQTGNPLVAAWLGTIDHTNMKVTGLPSNGRVIQLRSAIVTSFADSFRIAASSGETLDARTKLVTGQRIEISMAGGVKKVYTIETGTAMPETNMTDSAGNMSSIRHRIIRVSGKTELRMDSTENPLYGSFLDLLSDDVWLYFDNIIPSRFRDQYLDHIAINGMRPQIDTNIRLVQYGSGCVVISHPATYKPLEIFTGMHLGGMSMALECYKYYRIPELGAFNDAIGSFRLKKGYMATFAQNDKGTGHSKVFIAHDRDTVVSMLPDSLRGRISFVRVFPWRWVSKKGWTNTVEMADTLRAKWTYNWNNNRNSTLDAEYVPIRQTRWWPSFTTINAMLNTNHLLGFNEPDNPQQADAYCTVDQAIAAWEPLMESGLRIGSPAPTDGGLNYLYSFIDKADSAGFRVDFVAVHFYRGCQTAAQYYNFLKGVHERTGRPLWVTEFNNGANWTTSTSCPLPSYEQQAATIRSFLHMLDTAAFVERYCLYEWVQSTRQMFNSTNPVVLNPAGIVYRDQASPVAYNPVKAYEPYPNKHPRPFTKNNLAVLRFGNESYPTANANPMFIDEYTTDGAFVQSIPVPAVKSVRNLPLVSSSTPRSNSDGMLTLSPDGGYLAFAGYNTIAGSGSTNAATAAIVPRGVAIIDSSGQINTQSSYNDLVSQHVVRGAVFNNGSLYMTGGSVGGMRYGPVGKGTTTASVPLFTTPGTTKKVLISGGDVYFSQNGTGWPKINKLSGTPGAPTTPSGLSGIPDATTGSAVNGFVLYDMSDAIPGMDLLYYVDESPDPVLCKYIFDGNQWLSRGTYPITGMNESVLKDITGTLVDNLPVIYGTSFSGILKLEDKAINYTDAINISPKVIVNKNVNSNSAFRGIAFTPGTLPVLKRLVTGIRDLTVADDAVIAYPNPVTDRVHIHLANLRSGAELQVCDVQGKLLKTERITRQKQETDLSGLRPGILLLRVRNGKKLTTLSLIKL